MSDLKRFEELQSEQEIFIGYVSSAVKDYKDMEDVLADVKIWDIRNKNGERISHGVSIGYEGYRVLDQNGMVGEDGAITFRADLCFRNIKFALYKKLEI
ncbi:MAG: hypothetical protein LBE72_06190 [Rickettsia sp.]|jgi:hypothetical protein|nr:hypothetical protein [Rickettsia sp.]